MEDDIDPDLEARAFAMEVAMWFYECTESAPGSLADLKNAAEDITHYLTNGQANEFKSAEPARKCVSGQ